LQQMKEISGYVVPPLALSSTQFFPSKSAVELQQTAEQLKVSI
jgi:hypothetical protein